MNRHRRIRMMLYEYLRNELPPSDRLRIETHIASCRGCAGDMDVMRSTLGMLTVPHTMPSDERSEEFWNEFPTAVLHKTSRRKPSWMSSFIEIGEWIDELFSLHRGQALAAAGTVVTLLVVFGLWTFRTPRETEFNGTSASLAHSAAEALGESQGESGVTPERVSQYFRKSKTLLVGVANLRTDQATPLDFSEERRASRDLVREARYLRRQPIDPRSRRLMDDMEGILIGLSNIEGNRDLSSVNIIRHGIHHENLLFKVRMAEAMYDSTNFAYASER